MLSRRDYEEREDACLAPYAMRSAASRGRIHDEPEHPNRPAYQRDRERIIHSTAFRRLEYKTQVFVNHEGDHYRTRLTHTMEVAQIARAIARALNVNEDLAEAVALAHDLGHTPFGHSGEDALRELMKDHGGFEHNTHGLRVVEVLEDRYPGFRGLNLTYEVRECIAKHVTDYDHPSVERFNPQERQPIEGQIVEAADSIAYVSHDLDDGVAARILDESAYDDVPLLTEVRGIVQSKLGDISRRHLRTAMARFLINRFVTDMCERTLARIAKYGIRSVEDVRRAPVNLVCMSEELSARKSALSAYLFDHVYRHYRVARMANKARQFVRRLFEAYTGEPRQLPPYFQKWVDVAGLHQGVCDYIAGMTDRYAQDEYLKLFTPYERV